MIKPIKITLANRPALIAALAAANGKASQHIADATDIFWLAKKGEEQVVALVGSKKFAVGAKVYWRSGSALPNAYKYSRRVTGVYIQRKSKEWWLTSAVGDDARKEAGAIRITLTQAQDALAKAKFSSQYCVSTT